MKAEAGGWEERGWSGGDARWWGGKVWGGGGGGLGGGGGMGWEGDGGGDRMVCVIHSATETVCEVGAMQAGSEGDASIILISSG